jgi:hypothetical protein
MGYGSVSVGTATSVLIVSANTLRLSVIIVNNGSSLIYLGDDSLVSSNTGLPLNTIDSSGGYYEDSGGTRTYLGDYYAISQNSKNDVRYWERTR